MRITMQFCRNGLLAHLDHWLRTGLPARQRILSHAMVAVKLSRHGLDLGIRYVGETWRAYRLCFCWLVMFTI